MIRIACDARCILDNSKTGIGHYANNLMKYLSMNKDIYVYYHVFENENTKELLNGKIILNRFKKLNYRQYQLLSKVIPIPYHWIFGSDDDVTIFFNYMVPPGVSGKRIVMIHDMTYKVYPETLKFRTKLWLNFGIKKSVDRADKIITASEFSKQEMIKYLDIPESKISVISCGVDSIYHPHYSKGIVEKIKNKYKIKKEYYLYTGTIEPRKNIKRLLIAYGQLSQKYMDLPQLVLVGKRGWLYNEVFETYKKYDLEDKVIFTGYIPTFEIPILMNGAKVFIYPSLYEGFGMPVLEAMSCKTPVITSNASSLPEVVGDSAFLINPFSISDIKNAILRLEKDEQFRKSLAQKGYLRSKKFSWEKVAEKMLEILKNI